MLSVRRLETSEFVTEVIPRVAEREVENNLMLGIARRLVEQTDGAADAVLAAVEARGELVGAVVRTPPRYPVVTRLPEGAARAIAEFFSTLGEVPDGAIGPDAHGHDLTLAFAELRGGRIECASDELVYELTAVLPPAQPPGFARLATVTDVPIVTRYFGEFFREVVLPYPPDPATMAAAVIEQGRALLWDDSGVRSMACTARRTPTGIALAPVYTSPDARGRGYGSAVTAELCQRLLDSGNRFVCLHAERKNEISNRIYRAIGFRHVANLSVWSVH